MVYNCKRGQDKLDNTLLKASQGALRFENKELKAKIEDLERQLQEKKSITEWQKELYTTAFEKGWHGEGKEKTLPECLLLLHAEISEACEEYRKGYEPGQVWYSQSGKYDDGRFDKPEGIVIELADVFIRLLDLCEQFGISLEDAVKLKNDFNKTRSFRHGDKKI